MLISQKTLLIARIARLNNCRKLASSASTRLRATTHGPRREGIFTLSKFTLNKLVLCVFVGQASAVVILKLGSTSEGGAFPKKRCELFWLASILALVPAKFRTLDFCGRVQTLGFAHDGICGIRAFIREFTIKLIVGKTAL